MPLREIVIRIEVPEGASDAEVLAKIEELVKHADDLHRAAGGHGLRVKELAIVEREEVPPAKEANAT